MILFCFFTYVEFRTGPGLKVKGPIALFFCACNATFIHYTRMLIICNATKKANFIYLLHVLWVKHLLHGKIL